MNQFRKDFLTFATTSHSLTPVYNKNGLLEYFTFDYYIDYHEEEAVEDLVNNYSDITTENIYNILGQIQENLFDGDYHYIEHILSNFLSEYPQYKDKIDYHDFINTFEIYGKVTQYERFIYDTHINVNILLNTHDDDNLMYGNNNSSAIIDALQSENYSDYEELINESSLITLLNSQGITERMFYNYITSGSEKSNKFLDTLYNELLNGYSHEAVTFFTKMKVSDYLKLKEAKAFKIPKNIECGLVGFLNGSGSVLNIELQNDITLKHDQVIIEVDGAYNYGIMQIYGLVGYEKVDINIINEGNVQ